MNRVEKIHLPYSRAGRGQFQLHISFPHPCAQIYSRQISSVVSIFYLFQNLLEKL